MKKIVAVRLTELRVALLMNNKCRNNLKNIIGREKINNLPAEFLMKMRIRIEGNIRF